VPVSMTFNSLQDDLRRYLERGTVSDTEVFDQLPSLINLAERDIAKKLKILGTLNVVTDTLVIGTAVYLKPDRWLRTASINFGVGTSPTQVRRTMYPRSYEYCRMYWPNTELTDEPVFYADYDFNHWLIVPTPAAAYPFEVNYWQQPPLLDSVNQTNWLTDHAPKALLHGTLLQCTPFLKNDERIPTWETAYTGDLADLNTEDLQRIVDRTTTRQGV